MSTAHASAQPKAAYNEDIGLKRLLSGAGYCFFIIPGVALKLYYDGEREDAIKQSQRDSAEASGKCNVSPSAYGARRAEVGSVSAPPRDKPAAVSARDVMNTPAGQAVRAHPKAPELGATPTESAGICARQGGAQTSENAPPTEPGMYYVCRVANAPIYAGHVAIDGRTFDAMKVFYENADIETVRPSFEARFGAPDGMNIENDFRVWRWEHTNPRMYMRSYASGVSVTFRLAETVSGEPPD